MQSGSSISLNRLSIMDKLSEKRKVTPSPRSSEQLPNDYFSKIAQRVIENAVDQSTLNARIAEVHKFAITFFGNSIEGSIALDFLSTIAPEHEIINYSRTDCLVDSEPMPIEFENWNRGCVNVVHQPPAIMLTGNQVSVTEGDTSYVSFQVVDHSYKRRASQRRIWLEFSFFFFIFFL